MDHPGYEEQLRVGNVIVNSTVLARRTALNAAGMLDEAPGLRGVEDFDLWLALSTVGSLHCLPQVLGSYHADRGISSRIAEQKVRLSNLLWKHASFPRAPLSPSLRLELVYRAARLRAKASLLRWRAER